VDSLEKRVESLEDWQKKAVNELTDIKNTLNNLAKQQEETNKRLSRIEKELKYVGKSFENFAISIEEEAIEFLTHKLRKEYNLNAFVRRFELENVAEFDIYADLGDKIILGEVKIRAGISSVKQLEKVIEKLLSKKPELRSKKIIPMIYAKRYTEGLIEECERKGIYITTGFVDLTKLKLND